MPILFWTNVLGELSRRSEGLYMGSQADLFKGPSGREPRIPGTEDQRLAPSLDCLPVCRMQCRMSA